MEYPQHYRPTLASVNLESIQKNIKNLKLHIPKGVHVIAVVKANGYGHGEVEVAKAAINAGVEMIAVATPEEAVLLRREGVTGPILVLGLCPVSFARVAAELDITLTVSSAEWIVAVEKNPWVDSAMLKIHVKIDSGMGRIGLTDVKEIIEFERIVNCSEKIVLDGIYTHFACADESSRITTQEQFDKFMHIVGHLTDKPRLVHACNSAAALLYPELALDAVRFGISMYGIAPSVYVQSKMPFVLERALSLESELMHVKLVQKGKPISYGGTYLTLEDEWIGTLPIGYADGLRRGLRGQEVLIDGQRMPIIGTICMDQCMVKLTREYPVGTVVTLIGSQNNEEIKMEEWAERLHTIPYEVAVSISKRVPRIFTRENG